MKSVVRSFLLVSMLLTAWLLAGCAADLGHVPQITPGPTATGQAAALPPPTATATPQPTPPAQESPTPVPLVERPEDFEQYADAIVTYLNDSQGDEDGLRTMIEKWEALRHVTDLLRVDVDDDGRGELVMVVVDPSPDYGVNLRGDVLVVDKDEQRYSLAYSAAGESLLLDPALIEIDDLNGEGHTEIAFSSTSCGAHTCFTTVYIVASGTGQYQDLTSGGIEMSYVEPSFVDWDGDGVRELIMYGGTIGSVGAGPQRERTEVYKWDGTAYVLSETVYDYSNYLYFKVLDANQALLDANYEEAVALYREAIDNPNLDVWMEEGERVELAAFSRYRLTLTHLLLGEVASAEATRDELLGAQPDSIYAQVVNVFWDAYEREADLKVACEQVGEFAIERPETVEVLVDYGYGNPTFTPEEVCPIELF
jgi:tetratricopeptide (TPR) repeat protein